MLTAVVLLAAKTVAARNCLLQDPPAAAVHISVIQRDKYPVF
jgi:hypothetical protein